MNHQEIQSISLNDDNIAVLFTAPWFQEDITVLCQLLLKEIPKHQVKEITQGADRENVRFSWLNAEFVLNFDYYSQSCWFSAQDDISLIQINPLFGFLTQSITVHV